MTISSANPTLIYVSIFDKKDGKRITSYAQGVHGDTEAELREKAQADYPDAYAVTQTASDWQRTVDKDMRWDGKQLTDPPQPTEDEIRQAKLDALDGEYAGLIRGKEDEMARAQAIGDTDLLADLKTERDTLVKEYEDKRGEI